VIKNIIFDLGNVLIKWDPKRVYRTIFDNEEEVNIFLDNICTYDWNVLQDAGRTLSAATKILVKKHPEWKEEIEAYYGRWEEMLGGPIEGSVKILEEVLASKKYGVYALTNWSAETFPIAQEQYDFLGWFQGIVVSGEEKCKKPEAKIYKVLFDRYKLKPEECLFIDDSLANVEGSIKEGMPAVHFKSAKQLRSELKKRNLL